MQRYGHHTLFPIARMLPVHWKWLLSVAIWLPPKGSNNGMGRYGVLIGLDATLRAYQTTDEPYSSGLIAT